MRYWLMKSEPAEFSIDDLAAAPRKTAPWFGVRNYQARKFKALVSIGVLRGQAFCKEKLFVHPKLMTLLTRDRNTFESYRKGERTVS